MRLFAIDTSSRDMSASVVSDGKLLSCHVNKGGNSSDESIIPCADFALSEAGVSLDDIDVFAAVQGPGSFTGLRIGISVIKAFAYARKKPCVGVSTLDVLAYGVIRQAKQCSVGVARLTYVCPVMDARNNRYYTALYDARTGSGVIGSCVLDIGALAGSIELLKNGAQESVNVVFTGDAARKVLSAFPNASEVGISLATESLMIQNAGFAGLLAYSSCTSRPGEVLISSAELAPRYMNDGYYCKSGVQI